MAGHPKSAARWIAQEARQPRASTTPARLAPAAHFTLGRIKACEVRCARYGEQLEETSDLAINLGNHILRKLAVHDGFTAFALPSENYPPRFNRYTGGGTYGVHVDRALMPVAGTPVSVRGDFSATLFFPAPDEYEGGILEIRRPPANRP